MEWIQICVWITQDCLFKQISAVLKNKPKYSIVNTEKTQTIHNLSSFSLPHKERCLTTMKGKKKKHSPLYNCKSLVS